MQWMPPLPHNLRWPLFIREPEILVAVDFLWPLWPMAEPHAIDYREKAPAAAHRDMYLDSLGNARINLSQNGHLASGVPGTIAGLFASHKYAKLPFAELINPAIELAEKGFAITASEASSLNSTKNDFIKYNTKPNAFVRDKSWKAGDTLVQTDLANTLKTGERPGHERVL